MRFVRQGMYFLGMSLAGTSTGVRILLERRMIAGVRMREEGPGCEENLAIENSRKAVSL